MCTSRRGCWPAAECCRNRARPANQAWRGLWAAALGPRRQAVRSGRRTALLMSTEPAPWPQGHPDALVLDGGAVLTLGRPALPETASEMPTAAEPPPPGPAGPVRGGGQLLEMSFYLLNFPCHRPSSEAPTCGDSGFPVVKVGSGVVSWQRTSALEFGQPGSRSRQSRFVGEEGSASSPLGRQ